MVSDNRIHALATEIVHLLSTSFGRGEKWPDGADFVLYRHDLQVLIDTLPDALFSLDAARQVAALSLVELMQDPKTWLVKVRIRQTYPHADVETRTASGFDWGDVDACAVGVSVALLADQPTLARRWYEKLNGRSDDEWSPCIPNFAWKRHAEHTIAVYEALRVALAVCATPKTPGALEWDDAAALQAIPELDIDSGKWVRVRKAAMADDVTTASLKTVRGEGQKAADGLTGIDPQGRIWRKPSRNAHTWYLRSSLRNSTASRQ